MANRSSSRAAVRVLTTDGLLYLRGLDQHDASAVGRHWNAVRHYLDTGESMDLADIDGVELDGLDEDGARRRAVLETDLDAIDVHAIRGDVRFESIYDEVQ